MKIFTCMYVCTVVRCKYIKREYSNNHRCVIFSKEKLKNTSFDIHQLVKKEPCYLIE